MKYILSLSLAILFITGLAACGDKKEKKQERPKEAVVYKTMTPELQQISGTVQLPGVLQPFQFVQIFPKVSGFVKEVYVDRGSIVKTGTLLIRMEAPEIEEHASAAKLKYTEARALYLTSKDRYLRLLETSKTAGAISPFDLSAAASKMLADSAVAQGEYANYKAQQDMYSYLTITAPFDGVITERDVHPGALAGPGAQGAKPMLVLQQQSKLRLVVNIPEQYSAQIKNADIVHYKVNALPGQDFIGKVSRSSGDLNSTFRSETIEIDVSNPKNIFKAGMYAEVVLPVSGSASAYVVPKSAIVTTTERKYIIGVEGGLSKWIDITEGNQQNDSTEIFCSLQPGEKIVSNASYQIKDGVAISTQ